MRGGASPVPSVLLAAVTSALSHYGRVQDLRHKRVCHGSFKDVSMLQRLRSPDKLQQPTGCAVNCVQLHASVAVSNAQSHSGAKLELASCDSKTPHAEVTATHKKGTGGATPLT